MRFWLRELAGWILVLLGLAVFYLVIAFVANGYIIEASGVTIVGFVIFRGGIHLLKVAVAARLCLAAHKEQKSQRAAPSPVPARRHGMPPEDLV